MAAGRPESGRRHPDVLPGIGALPFDRSTREITAHALQAWSTWGLEFDPTSGLRVRAARRRGPSNFFPEASVLTDRGSRCGSVMRIRQTKTTLSTGQGRVLLGLHSTLLGDEPRVVECRRAAVKWLLEAQNEDGGWGGSRGVRSSIEETGVALAALSRSLGDRDARQIANSVAHAGRWLSEAIANGAEQALASAGRSVLRSSLVLRGSLSSRICLGRAGRWCKPPPRVRMTEHVAACGCWL